jgi:energy-coupling factor transport system permease protein
VQAKKGETMSSTDTFSEYHPIVNFIFFGIVLLFSLISINPACTLISLICAGGYYLRLGGKVKSLLYAMPTALLAAIINMTFNHEGVTTLCYLPGGNPLTLESILYGFTAAMYLLAVLVWFMCYTKVVTSDKFVYIFGKLAPGLALIISMALRLVPRLISQGREIAETQRAVSSGGKQSIKEKIKSASAVLSILITWSLENAIDMSDSMKSRGYGLKGRTAFSIYRISGRDKAAIAWMALCTLFLVCGAAAGGLYFRFYPSIKAAPVTLCGAMLFAAFAALCLTPVIIDVWEDRKWKYSGQRD